MSRRKPHGEDQALNPILQDGPILALPAPRIGHKREHEPDAYESPPGAVLTQHQGPIKRKLTAADRKHRREAQAEQQMRANRYDRYLDLVREYAGDREAALAAVYGLTKEAARAQLRELLTDVQSGRATSSVSQTLENYDLSLTARANLLRTHAYSDNPAASLKAVQLAGELEGNRADLGSFEDYLRISRSQE